MKDVAGMLRSFGYAAYAGLFAHTYPARPSSLGWRPGRAPGRRGPGPSFLRGYFATAGKALFVPADPVQRDALLKAFAIDKALYELNYELNNRPDWVRIPLARGAGVPRFRMTFPCFGAFPGARGVNFRLLVGDVPTLGPENRSARGSLGSSRRRIRHAPRAGRREPTSPGRRGSRRSLQLSPRGRRAEAGSRVAISALRRARAIRGHRRDVRVARRVVAGPHARGPRGVRAPHRDVHRRGNVRCRAPPARDLRALGITAIELMPVADFGGSRNWGYDGVACSHLRATMAGLTICARS